MRRVTGSRATWWSAAPSLSTEGSYQRGAQDRAPGRKKMWKSWFHAMATAALVAGASPVAWSQISGDTVKLGVLTDMSGIYSDNSGAGMVLATRMAVDDFGGKVNGKLIEVIAADHQNKA